MTIGIMSAMREQIASLVMELGTADEALHTGMRTYHRGRLWGFPVVLVFSRWGKELAACAVIVDSNEVDLLQKKTELENEL